MATVTLTGDAARILTHVARQSWFAPPPEEIVTVAERTPRQYLAFRRRWWIVWTLLGGACVACLGMLTMTSNTRQPPEAELALVWFGIFGAALLLSTLAWTVYRAGHVATLGPLDASVRTFRAEPDSLVIEAPGFATRRLDYAAVQTCVVEGERDRHGWILTALTLDDGLGQVQLQSVWLTRQRLLVALADRLLRSGAVASAVGPDD